MFTMLSCDDPGIVLVGHEVDFMLQGLPDLDQFILKWPNGRCFILNWFKLGGSSQLRGSLFAASKQVPSTTNKTSVMYLIDVWFPCWSWLISQQSVGQAYLLDFGLCSVKRKNLWRDLPSRCPHGCSSEAVAHCCRTSCWATAKETNGGSDLNVSSSP